VSPRLFLGSLDFALFVRGDVAGFLVARGRA
jgi:hypothetical protein